MKKNIIAIAVSVFVIMLGLFLIKSSYAIESYVENEMVHISANPDFSFRYGIGTNSSGESSPII